ncbi:hypothetical protein ACSF83_03355 [Lactobacillus johnsonii]|mgnify:FL=1|jgi:hypothetical protein|uniref:hypothetical protein n=1 Tax=Lactobacillus johnsonii TaxID=33959 RepID=UPI000207C00C|nr:hypothetical protein [Lactobacillus johnsonii]AEB93114.1 hypothetical protein LJP_0788 [Lactobacillus johnsonii DPC 6026]
MTNDINDKVLTENQKDYVIDLIRNLNKKYEDIIQEINHEVPSKDKIVHELDQLSFLSKNLSDCVYGLSTDF